MLRISEWLLMQGTNTVHLEDQDQWLLMQRTEVQNKCARKEVAENWLNMHFT